MTPPKINARVDSAAVMQVLDELMSIHDRRGSLPEFCELFAQVRSALGNAFEPLRFDGDGGTASACDVVGTLQFAQPFLDLLSALRALDRDFDAAGNSHGASMSMVGVDGRASILPACEAPPLQQAEERAESLALANANGVAA